MGDFRQLVVWQRAHTLALRIYQSTGTWPAAERYGITQQLRRAAVSVTSNIAEGCGRAGDRELIRYLKIARGSICEVQCQLLLAADLGYGDRETILQLAVKAHEISRQLTCLGRSLEVKRTHRP